MKVLHFAAEELVKKENRPPGWESGHGYAVVGDQPFRVSAQAAYLAMLASRSASDSA